jgi:predicted acylesterase/phospholipase RssA
LLASKQPIGAVAGSSSGAIAAAVVSLFPHRLEEFTEKFLWDRGRALTNLNDILLEEEPFDSVSSDGKQYPRPMLVVAATNCMDGSMKLFTFDPTENHANEKKPQDIMRAIQAACTIPISFHPFDMFGKSSLTYPDEEGVEIDGGYCVDGGIAAPAPPTPLDSDLLQ